MLKGLQLNLCCALQASDGLYLLERHLFQSPVHHFLDILRTIVERIDARRPIGYAGPNIMDRWADRSIFAKAIGQSIYPGLAHGPN